MREASAPDAGNPLAKLDAAVVPDGGGWPDLSVLANANPTWGKSIGHTSVVYKLKLEGGADVAFKPRSKRGPTRYKGEIAAFRLAAALGLANVPPAAPRSFPYDRLLAVLGGKDAEAGGLLAREAITDDAGRLPGAIIHWVPHLEFLPLEAEPQMREWTDWLGGATEVPPDKLHLAGQVSTMIVFDYLTGNWDRWSGGQIGYDARRDMLLFMDNDGAFYDTPPPGPLATQKGKLSMVVRFSRGIVSHLRALDRPALVAAMGEEAPGAPLLGEKAVAGLLARKEEALRIIDKAIARVGEARVLVFD